MFLSRSAHTRESLNVFSLQSAAASEGIVMVMVVVAIQRTDVRGTPVVHPGRLVARVRCSPS
jgi:hypothetical protein